MAWYINCPRFSPGGREGSERERARDKIDKLKEAIYYKALVGTVRRSEGCGALPNEMENH